VVACLAGAEPALAKPRVTGFSFSPSTFAVAPHNAASANGHRATTIRFKLSPRATIRIRIARKRAGRRTHGHCVKPTAKLRHRRACTRRVTVGRLVRANHKGGQVAIPFSGRVHGRRLKAGRYHATLVAFGNSGRHTKPKTASFKVVRRQQTPTPSPSGFPNATNTGVPAVTKLSAYSGPSRITKAGTVIDGKNIGCLQVAAPNVVIRNSHISCNGSALLLKDGPYNGNWLLVEDSEIDCKGGGGSAVGEANMTLRRVNIHGCENGGDLNQNFLIEDSYIHDMYEGGGSHTDGFQMTCGHYEAGASGNNICGGHVPSFGRASRNLTFRHNTILSMGAGASTPESSSSFYTTSAIISNPASNGPDHDILIENNLLAGGAYTLYCEQDGKGSNYRVIGNHFTTRFKASVGYFGRSTDCSDETQSGNVMHETGRPIHLE
jgi:hypothetical protein